jgi:putative FmdB family regulatory protein
MPAYDFKCKVCSEVFEVTRSASDDSDVPCPACGGETKRVFHPVGVHFKGTGFHNTDYRKSGTKTAEPPAPKTESCEAAGTKPACDGCPAASD